MKSPIGYMSAIFLLLWIHASSRASDSTVKPLILDKSALTHMRSHLTGMLPEQGDLRRYEKLVLDIRESSMGLSPLCDGTFFSPVDRVARVTSGVIGGKSLSSGVVKQIVMTGPTALPWLLEHLEDRRETKLTVSKLAGTMWTDRRLSLNPVNAHEVAHWLHFTGSPETPNELTDYRVSFGDVCYVILGQIVSRQYSAIRYQPSGCAVVCSPVVDRELATYLRQVWGGTDAPQKVLDSLAIDFATRAQDLGGLDEASILQCEAAKRLLLYFPDQAGEVIANRVAGLDIRHHRSDRDSFEQDFNNGVDIKDFVSAIAWSTNSTVAKALNDKLCSTTCTKAIEAGSPWLTESEPFRKHVLALIDTIPPSFAYDDAENTKGFAVLLMSCVPTLFGSDEGGRVFRKFVEDRELCRVWAICHALSDGEPKKWIIEFLREQLDDRRSLVEWTREIQYVVSADDDGVHVVLAPERICDCAARALSWMCPNDYSFDQSGSYDNLDRQIEVMKRRLDQKMGELNCQS